MSEIAVEYLLARPGREPPQRGATITLADGKVAAVAAGHGEGRGLLAMPALCDAHDHVRGLHHLAFGARDQNFELWRAALYAQPAIDPYLNAALAFGRLAQAGVGTVMHVYSSIRVDRLAQDAEAIARAARDVGVRLGFVVPLRDQQTIGYGPDEELLGLHEPQDREFIRQTWLYPFPSPATYMDLVADVARRIEGPTVSVQYGPNSPQACSDALLAAIGQASERDGRRITTHLLETSIQREWADAAYPGGFVRHLADLGIVCPRFTGAHGIWLRPDDIAIMAGRQAQIAVNASSNLRLRSGIAPVAEYIRQGMPFSFGVDSFSIDDDEDALREMRVANWLFSPHDTDAPLTAELLFRGWHRNGFLAVTGQDGYGDVVPGAPGDVVVLDYDAMAFDVIEDMIDPTEVLLTRACARHVRSVHVAGREIVRDGRVTGIDLPAVEREVIAQARASGARMRELKPVLDRSQATLKRFYGEGLHRRGPPAQ
ncbi:MAG: hypothetical protein JWR08_1866 [Enterovirga sp.]|nr:hypothetical protein [Enterovirga sp.]